MGSVFALNTVTVPDMCEAVFTLGNIGYDTCAAALDSTAASLLDKKVNEKTCFIVGNEGSGLSKDVLDASGSKVYIPMAAGAESLNVASASSILMWKMLESIQ